jgi:hypothetical protein
MNLSGVRNAIIAKVDGLTGFRMSPFPVELFDRSQNTLAHLAFAVSISSTQSMDERQRVPTRVFMSSNVNVIFAFRIRPHSVSADYNNAMDKEITVIETILGSYASTPGIEIRYNQSIRTFAQSLEYVLIETNYTVVHTP